MAKRHLMAYQFPSLEDGFLAIVEMCDNGLLPAVFTPAQGTPGRPAESGKRSRSSPP